MSSATSEIEKLFRSTGFFPSEYKDVLFSLDLEGQKQFITELYRQVTSEQFKHQQGRDAFGVKIFEPNTEYRYSEEDLEKAKKMEEPLSGETFLKATGKEEECLLYRATYIFHQRKVSEIEFEAPEIERLYKSISNRIEVNRPISSFIDGQSIFKDLSFEFIKYPPLFTKEDFKTILSKLNLKECFYSNDHYRYFLSNTFEFYKEGKKPLLINLPLTHENKMLLPKKVYQLYKKAKNHSNYKEGLTIYPELKIIKTTYAKALFCNFSVFRESQGNNQTFEGILSNTEKKLKTSLILI